MKRFTLTLLLGLFAVSLQACASGQSVTPQTPSSTSGSSIGSTIGNLLEGVFSRSDIDVADMSGIWTVDGSAVAFKSQDFMAKAGGAAVAAKLQTELDPYYQRYGLTGAVLTIDSDGNCSIKLARGSLNGVITKQAKGEFLFNITLLGKIPAAKILLEAMAVVKPTIICCVPMILEKVYRKQVLPLLEKGPMSIAVKIPLLNAAIYSVIRKKLMDAFGGNVSIFIVGGAPMNQETEAFLMKIRFPITIGYGMTECAPLISFTPDNEFKAGSCGRYLKNLLEVRIDSPDPEHEAGEIVVRGENVMAGYYKNEKDTQKVLDADGWLHTGDMGTMDPDGTLYIRGRSKTMILSGNGQNIYPEEIEDKLNNMYMVLESLVLDAGNGRLRALVVPDYEQADAEGVDKSELPQLMQNNLQELNAQLAAYERVSDITIYPTEFEKTPKRSIKRFLYSASLLDS